MPSPRSLGTLTKRRPGEIRDAVAAVLADHPYGASVRDIVDAVRARVGDVARSSVQSSLHLNTPTLFARTTRGRYALATSTRDTAGPTRPVTRARAAETAPALGLEPAEPPFVHGRVRLEHADCFDWLRRRPARTVHAVVTDPPYGLFEYTDEQQAKLRAGRGGVWRIPPSFDGARRAPLPRFTVLGARELRALDEFFYEWARLLRPVLVPGAQVLVAANPLLSYAVAAAVVRAGFERRGEIVRLVMTMRGGDRPKHAHEEFAGVSVMPRSMWEPWLVFRAPLDGRVQDNLRRWKTGGFRRPSAERPFGDVIESGVARGAERRTAPHPSLKPQAFLRQVVRGVLPLGEGVVLDPFAGSGSTLAAAEAVGYTSLGVERDRAYFAMARAAVPALAAIPV